MTKFKIVILFLFLFNLNLYSKSKEQITTSIKFENNITAVYKNINKTLYKKIDILQKEELLNTFKTVEKVKIEKEKRK